MEPPVQAITEWSTPPRVSPSFAGGGGYSGFQVTGMIEWRQKSKPCQNPQKSLDQNLTPKKSRAQFPSLKNFQKACNDQ